MTETNETNDGNQWLKEASDGNQWNQWRKPVTETNETNDGNQWRKYIISMLPMITTGFGYGYSLRHSSVVSAFTAHTLTNSFVNHPEIIWKVTQNYIEKSKSPTYNSLSRTLSLGIRRPSHPSKLSNHGTNTKQRQWLYKQALLPLNLYFRIHWILPPKKPVSQWTKLQDLHCKNTTTVIYCFFSFSHSWDSSTTASEQTWQS